MSQRLFSRALLAATLGAAVATNAHAGLTNGSFEDLLVEMPNVFLFTDAANVPGWNTTATDNQMEIWEGTGYDGLVPEGAAVGNRYAELNAFEVSTLYQDATGIGAGLIVGWELSHRGRTGPDTMRLTITDLGPDGVFGALDNTVLFTQTFTTDKTAWVRYSGGDIVALGNTVRFAFESVSAFGGDQKEGNFLDGTAFGVGVGVPLPPVPEPGTWAMMLAGLLVTAGIARRSRRA